MINHISLFIKEATIKKFKSAKKGICQGTKKE